MDNTTTVNISSTGQDSSLIAQKLTFKNFVSNITSKLPSSSKYQTKEFN